MNGLDFSDPPQRSREYVKHAPIAAQLREDPGQWARVASYATRHTAQHVAYLVRTAGLKSYAPAGAYEAEARGVDGAHVLFVRYNERSMVDESKGEVAFGDLPEPNRGRQKTDHATVAAELRKKPGQWAMISTRENAQAAGSAAHSIKVGRIAPYRPAGAYDAAARTVDGVHGVWACYVGEPA